MRDTEGTIIAMVGPATFTDTVNEAGNAAGCPMSTEAKYEYQSVLVDLDNVAEDLSFDVGGEFRQTLEVVASEGFTEERLQAGGINVGRPD